MTENPQRRQPKLVKYSDLSGTDLQDVYNRLNPENNNLYPSVVLEWSNEEDRAFLVIAESWVLGHLYPIEWDDFWSLSSKRPLSEPEVEQAISVIESMDPKARVLQNITPVSLNKLLNNPKYSITGQGDSSSNYLYSTSEVAACSGSKFSDMRRYLAVFQKNEPTTKVLSFEDLVSLKNLVLGFHDDWHKTGATDGAKMTDHERKALERSFENNVLDKDNIVSLSVWLGERLVGLTISEILPDGYALNHYFKAEPSFSGAGVYLFHETIKTLHHLGVHTLNYQEDLEIPGLRAFKLKMRPSKIADQLRLALKTS